MKITKQITFAVLTTLILSGSVLAQRSRSTFEPYSTVGVGLGVSSYVGELAPYRQHIFTIFKMMRYSASANYTRYFTPRLGARASLTWARVAGDDELFNRGGKPLSVNYLRNLHFRNDLKEFSLVGILNLKSEGRNSTRRIDFMPYLFGGIAVLAHNPKAVVPETYVSSRWVALQPLGTEGQGQPGYSKPYSLITYSVPLGVGFRWKLNDRWDVGVEGGFRFTGSDYIDDIGGYYADPTVLRGELATAMSNRSREDIAARTLKNRTATVAKLTGLTNPFSQAIEGQDVGDLRGSPSKKDAYMIASFQLSYVLPGKIRCPVIK
jgi:hypothetical protein